MSVSNEIKRDRRVVKARELAGIVRENLECIETHADPKDISRAIRIARYWELRLASMLFELEFYAALAAGQKLPEE